jgi:ribosomal protein S18 acetylase RimI-like enzyme
MLGPEAQSVAAVVALGDPIARDRVDWRSAVTAEDVERVRALVARTGFFNAAEIELAADLVSERVARDTRSGYHFVLAERCSALLAFACYGLIYGTRESFELYWIAVAPEEQGRGLGREIYARAEAAMREAGAGRVYADTSSSERYVPTRGFYRRLGFVEQAHLPDFYAPGDGKFIYVKALTPAG